MDSKIQAELSQPNQSAFHKALLDHCKALIEMSRSDMAKYYDRWEACELVYKGERYSDEEDKKACKQGAPSKIVIPLTYAQIQTFVSFGLGLLQQREHFFELEGTGEEDHRAAKLGEALLDQNLEYNQFTVLLYQFLLNIGRFSIGVMKHSWVKETESVWVEEDVPGPGLMEPMRLLGSLFNPAMRKPEKQQVKKEQVSYMGNKLETISPFCFYPDTRFPLNRYQSGEFCGSETEMSMTQLRKGEKDGIYAGVRHITKIPSDQYARRKGRQFGHYRNEHNGATSAKGQVESTVIVTSIQLEIVPNKFRLSDGSFMGTSDTPEKWIVEYANDSRVIRAEPLGYVHNHFTYSVAQFSPDEQGLINETISEMVGHLQAVIDWFINAHITNVRKHISNRLVVDPVGVEFSDIRDHKPVIRLKPGASNQGVDRFVKQLNVSDVTRGHIGDIQTLMQFVFMTTAISDNTMGQVNNGRRSAREISNTANASGQRLRTVIKLIYDGCLKPLGKDLLSNLRDGLDEDIFVTVSGTEFPDWQAFDHFVMKDGRTKVKINRTNIAGNFDFKVFEGILPSDKFAQAETLENTLLALMKNPQGLPILTQVLGYDPKKLFTEVLELRGIKHPQRFKIDEVRLMELQQAAQAQQQLENGPPNPAGASQPLPGTVNPGAVPAAPGSFEALIG